jgi:hypothetical protein
MLLVINVLVTIKYRIYENRSSLFITISLILLDIARMVTFLVVLLFAQYFLNSEVCIRLGHDIPSFLFDCVTIALIFQFIQTYEFLSDHQQAFQNMETQYYIRVEYTIVAIYVVLLIFDFISLGVDGAN